MASEHPPLGELSVKQREALRLRSQGFSNGEIVATMKIGKHRLQDLYKEIRDKMNTRDLDEAARRAQESGQI